MELERPPLPIGPGGRLEAVPLTNAAGNHAVLVREADTPRALLTATQPDQGRHRLLVLPLDDDVSLHVDGDALAVWLAEGPIGPRPVAVPAWASFIGLAVLLLLLALTVVGTITVFGWLLSALGVGR
ncbi:MAG: hypothetical protein DLM71_02085 [Chloroflexi bacterium]|nr:MAG: hypothetical protein DLM71_02085 [Chloroflexota bacterium]